MISARTSPLAPVHGKGPETSISAAAHHTHLTTPSHLTSPMHHGVDLGSRLVSERHVSHTLHTGSRHVSGTSRLVTSPTVKLEQVVLPEGTREVDQRLVSTRVVEDGQLSAGHGFAAKQEHVRYVEVPVYQEVVKEVKKKETRHVEKRVPKYEVEVVDRVVEVPQIEWVDKHVEVPRTETIIKHVPKIEVVDRNIDVVKHIPIIEFKEVEKIVEVPNGEVIEVPKPYTVEDKRVTDVNIDTKVPVVIAQSVRPVIKERGTKVVDVIEYEPEPVVVDVHVAKPVKADLIAKGVVETKHVPVEVPAAQYNWILRDLNKGLDHSRLEKLPYRAEHGRVDFHHIDVPYTAHEKVEDVAIVNRGVSMTSSSSSSSSATTSVITAQPVTGRKCCGSRGKSGQGCCKSGSCGKAACGAAACAGACAGGKCCGRSGQKKSRGCCGAPPRDAPFVATTTKKTRNCCGKRQEITTHKSKGCCAPKVKVVRSHKESSRNACCTSKQREHDDVKVSTRRSPCYRGPRPPTDFYDQREGHTYYPVESALVTEGKSTKA